MWANLENRHPVETHNIPSLNWKIAGGMRHAVTPQGQLLRLADTSPQSGVNCIVLEMFTSRGWAEIHRYTYKWGDYSYPLKGSFAASLDAGEREEIWTSLCRYGDFIASLTFKAL